MPSTKSGVPAHAAKLAASASSCSESERASDSRMRRFALRIASVGPWASDLTTASTVASISASGTTLLTRPHASACCASKRSPSSMISMARRMPTRRGSAHDPPPSAVSAIARYAEAKYALSAATTRSHAFMRERPNPATAPCTWPITG